MNKLPIVLIIYVLLGCSTTKEETGYEQLTHYDGEYEYVGNTTIEIIASPMDTILYAILDGAKYPLKHTAGDTFTDVQNGFVVFTRDKSNRVNGYTTEGQDFKLISKDIERAKMIPRSKLFGQSEGYTYKVPESTSDGLETGRLEDAFQNSGTIIDMVRRTIAGDYRDVHSILIYKNDKLVLEEYFYGYDQNTQHQLRSAGKSIKGGLIGIAIDQGFINSEKDKLLPYFRSKYPEIANLDTLKEQITIEDFLMYRHGMDCENNNPESAGSEQAMMQSEDWIKHILDLPMVKSPGESSSYCTGCSITLNSLIEIAINDEIEDFARQYLFEPLGITNYSWSFEPNPSSINTFNQLYATPRDLLKLAIMYKDGGRWKGKQVLSQEWADKTFQMDEGDYGYMWKHKYFVVDGQKFNSYMATGNGGQKINIWPELDMITIFTGGNYNSYQLYGKATPPNEMIPNHILRAVR